MGKLSYVDDEEFLKGTQKNYSDYGLNLGWVGKRRMYSAKNLIKIMRRSVTGLWRNKNKRKIFLIFIYYKII